MKLKLTFAIAFLTLVVSTACGGSANSPATNAAPAAPDTYPYNGTWTLVWSDDFAGANGSLPAPANWVFETGGGGWGNNELETYTNRPQNAQQQDGNLVITAAQETYTGTDGISRNYTSARRKRGSRR